MMAARIAERAPRANRYFITANQSGEGLCMATHGQGTEALLKLHGKQAHYICTYSTGRAVMYTVVQEGLMILLLCESTLECYAVHS
jgi:hypothetical protein